VFATDPRPAGAAAFVERLRDGISEDRLREHVAAIARPRNRLTAPAGIRHAEDYVTGTLQDRGWHVERQPFVFTDVEGVPGRPIVDDPHPRTVFDRVEGANVLAVRPDAPPDNPLVVCAHLDSVDGSPGADDNGSGIAVVLALAEVLPSLTLSRPVLLALVDMEEIGCFGARALASRLRPSAPAGCLVLESVGYADPAPYSQNLPPFIGLAYPRQIGRIRRRGLRGDWTLVVYRSSSHRLARAFAQPMAHLDGRDSVVLTRDPMDRPLLGAALRRYDTFAGEFTRGDHAEFWTAGVPAIQITDTANFRNPHYHQPSDTPDTLDYGRVRAVAAATAAAVADISANPSSGGE
jgi:hypothetical protein